MSGDALSPICRNAKQWPRLPKSDYWVRCEPPSPILNLGAGQVERALFKGAARTSGLYASALVLPRNMMIPSQMNHGI
jgi:hypothetical protein